MHDPYGVLHFSFTFYTQDWQIRKNICDSFLNCCMAHKLYYQKLLLDYSTHDRLFYLSCTTTPGALTHTYIYVSVSWTSLKSPKFALLFARRRAYVLPQLVGRFFELPTMCLTILGACILNEAKTSRPEAGSLLEMTGSKRLWEPSQRGQGCKAHQVCGCSL